MAFSLFLTIFNSAPILSQIFFHYLCKKEYIHMPNILSITRTNKKVYLEPLPPYVRRTFCRFLKQNHVYTQFFAKNIEQPPPTTPSSSHTLMQYWYLVITAFTWSSTKEGWDFWSNISRKWNHICQQDANDHVRTIKSLLL